LEAHLDSPSEENRLDSGLEQAAKSATRRSSKDRVLIVICAYNEARALPNLLETLGDTKVRGQINVLVVDDGSSDGTGRLAETEGAIVITHWRRMGKAASLQDAIDYALDNGYGTVVEMGADAIPDDGSVDRLIRPLSSSGIGGASVRQIPLGRKNPSYFIDELIWSVLSHGKSLQMARRGTAHLGGVMYAFKPECVSAVEGSVNDDEQLGVCIKSNGYKAVFVPNAVAYFDASSSIRHILQRRRRMYYGHMVYPESTAPSMEISIVASALVKSVAEKPSRLPWVLPALFLDLVSRLRAWQDGRRPKKRAEYAMWVTTFEKNLVSDTLRGRW
jgi:cellulose synthase/poly-beta-1,6-N-acetylglucosamine synthase-like glycosyltransferase